MNKLNVLIVPDKLPAWLTQQANKHFNVIRLSDVENNPSWFEYNAKEIDAILTNGIAGADALLINRLPNLKIIASNGVGYDAIDLDAARRRHIIVTTTPGILTDCVADHAMGLMLDISRRLSEADRYLRDGKWLSQGKFPVGKKIGGKVCAIVGLGNIGLAVARRAEAFNMHIHYCSRTVRKDVPYTFHPTLHSLARAADYLVLTLPGGDATWHLINRQVLDALGPEGYLINVSRGSTIDESALIAALEAKTIAGAALDVFEQEPHVPDALLVAENVVLTPHIASSTEETAKAMADRVIENLLAFSQGLPVISPILDAKHPLSSLSASQR